MAGGPEEPLLRPCPGCGHAVPSMYRTSSGHCFDCYFTPERTARPGEEVPPRRSVAEIRAPAAGPGAAGAAGTLPSRYAFNALALSRPDAFAAALRAMTGRQQFVFIGFLNGYSLSNMGRASGVGQPAASKALARAFGHFRAAGLLDDGMG